MKLCCSFRLCLIVWRGHYTTPIYSGRQVSILLCVGTALGAMLLASPSPLFLFDEFRSELVCAFYTVGALCTCADIDLLSFTAFGALLFSM